MQVDGVDVIAEGAFAAAAREDAVERRDHAGVELAQLQILLQVLAVVDILDADEADEVRIALVMVEGRLDQPAQAFARVAAGDVELSPPARGCCDRPPPAWR